MGTTVTCVGQTSSRASRAGPGSRRAPSKRLGRSEAVGEEPADAGRVAGLGKRPPERLVTAGEHREPELARGVEAEREDSPFVGERIGVEKLDADSADAHAVVVDEGFAFTRVRDALESLGLEGAEGAAGLVAVAHRRGVVRRTSRRTRGRTWGSLPPRCRR